MLLDPQNTKFYSNPELAFTTKGEYKLSSDDSQKLIQRI